MTSDILLLGVDGGGSKTLAFLADGDGRVLGRGFGGSSNYFTMGKERAFSALEEAISASFATAGIERRGIAALCMGLAGVDRPADRAVFAPWCAEQFPGVSVSIVNDAELVLAAGTPQGWGIAVICGTGMIVFGRNRTGESCRSDGWGYLLSDLGSGFAIGLAALQAVMAAYDGRGPTTALSELIRQHCGVEALPGLLPWVYRERVPTSEIAALSRLVDDAAEHGDAVALSILQSAGRHLALSAKAVASRLAFGVEIPCAVAGGVITHGTQMVDSFRSAAQKAGLKLHSINSVLEPANGAIRLAQRLTGK